MGSPSLQLVRHGSPARRELLPVWHQTAYHRQAHVFTQPKLGCKIETGSLSGYQASAWRSIAAVWQNSLLSRNWRHGGRHRKVFRDASSMAGLPTTNEKDVEEMVEWLRQNGAIMEGVRVSRDGRGGLGLVAAADCRAGQRLLMLPPNLQLTYGDRAPTPDATYWPVLLELIRSVPEPLWALRLGLRLLSERARPGSFWWPYIRCLPQRYSVPIFFPPAAIAELAYPPLVEQVKKRSRFLLQLSAETLPAVVARHPTEAHPFGGQTVDAGALGWAMAAVSSRAFRVRGPLHPAALLPLVDMCNHNPSPSASLRGVAGSPGQLEVVALRDLQQGAPLELCYGELSNDLLLLDYGFVLPGCSHDRVEIRFDPALLDLAVTVAKGSPPKGPTLKAHNAVLAKLHLAGPNSNLLVTLGGPEHVDGRLLAATRSVCAGDRGAVASANPEALGAWGVRPPLGKAVEQKALRTLAGLCVLLLGQFPAPAEEGSGPPLGEEQRLAVAFRSEKQRILVDALRFMQGRLKEMEGPGK